MKRVSTDMMDHHHRHHHHTSSSVVVPLFLGNDVAVPAPTPIYSPRKKQALTSSAVMKTPHSSTNTTPQHYNHSPTDFAYLNELLLQGSNSFHSQQQQPHNTADLDLSFFLQTHNHHQSHSQQPAFNHGRQYSSDTQTTTNNTASVYSHDSNSNGKYIKVNASGRKICAHDGCGKLSQGSTSFCFSHGGGYRCQSENCDKPARGKSGFCISHGGGKRCEHPGCDKSAQGKSSKCKSHGGGRRCKVEGCSTSARGKTMFCVRHGGGRRCQHVSYKRVESDVPDTTIMGSDGRGFIVEVKCPKAARDNSAYCVGHGGGVRCSVEGCKKSAVGKTTLCTKHKQEQAKSTATSSNSGESSS